MVIKPTDTGETRKQSSPSMVVYATIADTTWRMFVPVFAGALVGYGLDRVLSTRPVGVLSGTFIGVAVAVLLVYLQYQSTKQR